MTQNIDHTNKPVLARLDEILDKTVYREGNGANGSGGEWLYCYIDETKDPRYFQGAEMPLKQALLTLFNNMCDERVANYREALSLYGAPQCYHLHHPRKYQHKLGNCPVENRINQLTKDNLLKGGADNG